MSMVKKQKVIDKEEEAKGKEWQDMKQDILWKIFSTFTLLEVALNISSVCKFWRFVCRNSNIWDTLDFTELKEHFLIPTNYPDIWSEPPLISRKYWDILKTAIYLGHENLTKIIFNRHICITDEHVVCIAERCPNVKLLVLPAWSRITPEGYRRAFQIWKGLEAMVLPGCTFSPHIIQLLGENCKKLTSLKMTGFVTKEIAFSLSNHIPWLKALSIKSSMLKKETLILTLEWLKELQELNISHSSFVDMPFSQTGNLIDESILEKSAGLQALHYCEAKGCMACLAVKGTDPPKIDPAKWVELVVRLDEIKALSY